MANLVRERSVPQRIAGKIEPEAEDDSERHQLMQWLEQMRSAPAGALHYWRPVLLVAVGLAAIFACLMAL